jgi:hypothetical protein
VNEPLLNCRKRTDDVRTGGKSLARDKNRRYLESCLFGIRHEGGVNLIQAFVWNLGTCRLNDKGETQEPKLKCESTDVRHRGGASRSSDEGSVMELERRTCAIQFEEPKQLEGGGL